MVDIGDKVEKVECRLPVESFEAQSRNLVFIIKFCGSLIVPFLSSFSLYHTNLHICINLFYHFKNG